MLFHTDDTAFESEKERNFYYKIFAGYIFNELIPGYPERLKLFIDILNNQQRQKSPQVSIPYLFSPKVKVSFDNHLYQLIKTDDRGEFADILVQDIKNKCMIPIEAKLFSDWSYAKDVQENGNRHQRIAKHMGKSLDELIFPVLLLAKNKWEECQNQQNKSDSNFKKLNASTNAFRVVLWEDLYPILESDPRVFEYADMMLHTKSSKALKMNIESGWMKRGKSQW